MFKALIEFLEKIFVEEKNIKEEEVAKKNVVHPVIKIARKPRLPREKVTAKVCRKRKNTEK
jgi:hypothetical protein